VSGLKLTLGWIASATGGSLRSGRADDEVARVVIDSRVLQPGDLFIAIRGPRFDGHGFVADVLARGAAGAIVARGAGVVSGADLGGGLIEVADTLQALQDLGHAVRAASGTRVVAITGSAGKTTTKETIAEFLSSRYRVVKNAGNLNNHIGLPLSLMQLRTRPDVAVMELGMNHAGEIRALVAIAEPEVRVWTNVGDAHIGFFASADAIADAKGEILEQAGADTLLVCNGDDSRIMARAKAFPGKVVTFGEGDSVTVRAHHVEDLGTLGMKARIATPAGSAEITTPLLGRGNLSNVLASTAVALELGVTLDAVVKAAAGLRPAERRGTVRALRGGLTLIDDSYNSSPSALRRALEVLGHEPRRKVAVLGEMLELGDHAVALHRECGQAAAAVGLAQLFAVGGAPARALAEAATAAGMPAASVAHFETSEQAAPAVAAAVRGGDVVLVKGSRGTRTDVVADRLAAEFA
jgi:UDP-N-acetylmuramoyl-tripeptide--D-alanyl-D-alanine ligase